MKLRTREIYLFIGVIAIALALPISIFVILRSQETRSSAGGVEIIVVPNKSQCAGLGKTAETNCFDIINTAVAVALANNEATVYIKNKDSAGNIFPYDQQFEIKTNETKSITIRGDGGGEGGTLIKNVTNTPKAGILGNGHAVSIDAPNTTVKFSNIGFTGSGGDSVIHIYSAKRVDADYVVLQNGPAAGIRYNAGEGTVSNSIFINNYWPGVSLHGASNVKISNSQFLNHQHAGVDATDTATLKIYGSAFDNNSLAFVGYDSKTWNHENHPHEVDADGNYYTAGSILAKKNSKLEVSKSTVTNANANSIKLGKGFRGTVEDFVEAKMFDNTITASKGATVFVTGENVVEIISNTISGNGGSGVYLLGTARGTITNNVVKDNGNEGITIQSCEYAKITNNTIVNNSDRSRPGGISLYRTGNIEIINNIIVSNKDKGIYVDTGNTESRFVGAYTLKNNDVWNNALGNYVGVEPGVGDISADPIFLNNGSYQLDYTVSPAKDAGDPALLDPNGSRSDMGAWGGPYADWGPTAVLKKEPAKETYCTAGIMVKDYVEYNDKTKTYTGEIGNLYIKDGANKYDLKRIKYADLNKAIAIPETLKDKDGNILNLKDGKDHEVILTLFNLYTYTDLDGNAVTERFDETLGVNMWNFRNDSVTLNCPSATPTPIENKAPTFGEIKDAKAYRQIPFVQTYTVTDPENDAITVKATIPTELDWLALNADTNNLSGTPVANAKIGTYSVKLTATDAKGNKIEKTFKVTVAEKPTNAVVINLDIDLQTKTDDTNTQIAVKVKGKNGTEVSSTNSVSNAEGKLSSVVIPDGTAGEYTIWIKPRGYLARKITKSLVVGDNNITVTDEFLTGDIDESGTSNIIKTADYSVLVGKYFQEDCGLRNLDGICMVNLKDVSLMYGNWFKIGDSL